MSSPLPSPSDHQRAAAIVRWGRRGGAGVAVDVTSGGLLAIGALVTSILLSTAVIVRVATPARDERR